MTVAFKTSANAWTSRYSYDTSCFAHVDNTMLSFNTSNASSEGIAYRHAVDSDKNSFYGEVSDSQFTVSVNDNPSKNKIYKAVSLEGANLKDATSSFVANLSPQFNQARESQAFEPFVEKGGVFYGGLTKSNLTDPTNSLKAVGGIKKAKRLTTIPAEDSVNNGVFPFKGYGGGDIFDAVFFEITPYPHYKQLGSASSTQVVSKYVLGFVDADGVTLRTPRVNILPDATFVLDAAADAIQGRSQTFSNQPDAIINTDGVSKYPGHIVVKINDSIVGEAPEDLPISNLKMEAFINAINTYVDSGGELMLFMITDDRINGADPRGQYGDLTITVPAVDFEIFAVNMDYEPTELDHSKG